MHPNLSQALPAAEHTHEKAKKCSHPCSASCNRPDQPTTQYVIYEKEIWGMMGEEQPGEQLELIL